ncbi:MAG: hypothetical protein JWO82_1628 [Akkermansiaceae bacterium]|nr:hypothetical protein [Akkermansiaceae bacterium]
MTKGKSLIFVSMLTIASCHKEIEAPAPETKPAATKNSATASSGADANAVADTPAGAEKASDRSAAKTPPPALGERLPGNTQAKSPYSSAVVDVAGLSPGSLVKDPTNGKSFTLPEELPTEDPDLAEKPIGVAVPGRAGMVFSPYNNKIVDVTGIPAGRLVADPTYPAAEKKFFRVPEAVAAPAPAGQ